MILSLFVWITRVRSPWQGSNVLVNEFNGKILTSYSSSFSVLNRKLFLLELPHFRRPQMSSWTATLRFLILVYIFEEAGKIALIYAPSWFRLPTEDTL